MRRSALFLILLIGASFAPANASDLAISVAETHRQTIDGYGYTLSPVPAGGPVHASSADFDSYRYVGLPLDLVAASPQQGVRDLSSFTQTYLSDGRFDRIKANGKVGIVLLPYGIPDYMLLYTSSAASGDDRPLNYEFVPKYGLLLADLVGKLATDKAVSFFAVSLAGRSTHMTPDQEQSALGDLRQIFDARGMQSVKIIAVDWPADDPGAVARLDAIKNEPSAWSALDAVFLSDTLSSPAADFYSQYSSGSGKELWMAQGPIVPGVSIPSQQQAAQMLSSLNAGACTWIAQDRLSPLGTLIAEAFPPGTQMRLTTTDLSQGLRAAAGVRANGTYVVAFTRTDDNGAPALGSASVRIKIPELASKGDVACTVRDVPADGANITESQVILHQGAAQVPLPVGDTIMVESLAK